MDTTVSMTLDELRTAYPDVSAASLERSARDLATAKEGDDGAGVRMQSVLLEPFILSFTHERGDGDVRAGGVALHAACEAFYSLGSRAVRTLAKDGSEAKMAALMILTIQGMAEKQYGTAAIENAVSEMGRAFIHETRNELGRHLPEPRAAWREWLSALAFGVLVTFFLWAGLQLIAAPHPDYPCSESSSSVLPACRAEPLR